MSIVRLVRSSIVFLGVCTGALCQVDSSSVITTVSGGASGFAGDGGPSSAGRYRFNDLLTVRGMIIDKTGNLLITDTDNNRIRQISSDGSVRTVAGSGGAGFYGDGGPALAASLSQPAS